VAPRPGTIRARLALAAARAETNDLLSEPASTPLATTQSDGPAAVSGSARSAIELDEVLTLLDDLADDADTLNTRIQALLGGNRPSRR